MTKAIEFYSASRGKSAFVDIVMIGNGERSHIETINVANKREARAIAKDLGATPWNF